LPEPNVVNEFTKEELTEVVKRIKEDVFEENEGQNFTELFSYHLEDYYHKLLKINFKKYKFKYFERQKGKNGKYFEYEIEEIVEKIWDK
jgi:rRNA maturation protein Rpf1